MGFNIALKCYFALTINQPIKYYKCFVVLYYIANALNIALKSSHNYKPVLGCFHHSCAYYYRAPKGTCR